jgi:hypothetical protein
MVDAQQYHFDIEWLTQDVQHYHGPRKRMKELLRKHPISEHKAYDQRQVIEYITTTYHQYVNAIDKIKFYKIIDKETKA